METNKPILYYVRGNEKRGDEVIKVLENIGGTRKLVNSCEDSDKLYFIGKYNVIISCAESSTAGMILQEYGTELKLSEPEYKPKDKELVWAWDKPFITHKIAGFYDKKNKCLFFYDGKRDGMEFGNYAPYKGEIEQWMIEAQNKLED